MCTMDFCGGFTARNADDPLEIQVNAFLKKDHPVPMDDEVLSWKQNNKVVVQGTKAVKTITRVARLKNGSEKTYTKQYTKDLDHD